MTGWVYCASIESETAEEEAAWREAMPAACDAVSSIPGRGRSRGRSAQWSPSRPDPLGQIVLLRNVVEGRAFCTAHKSQTVYHGPVVYLDDPQRHLESASSDLELALLLVLAKDAAQHAERE